MAHRQTVPPERRKMGVLSFVIVVATMLASDDVTAFVPSSQQAALWRSPAAAIRTRMASAAGQKRVPAKSKLPTWDKARSLYVPPSDTPDVEREFYSPLETLVRGGPIALGTRWVDPVKYQQAVLRYMDEAATDDWTEAQGNMDAFFSAPEVWAEQKLLEQQGKRPVYNYAQGPRPARVALALVWGSFVVGLTARVLWQLAHGNRNLF